MNKYSVGKGWWKILDDMFADMRETMGDEWYESMVVTQIKEKFGTLRVYLYPYSELVEHIIDEAEAKSAVTCERCGEPGELCTIGWMKTLCDECKRKRLTTW